MVNKRLWIYESHIPFRPELLFRPYFHYCLSSVQNYEDCFHIHVFIRSSSIWLSYIHSREQLISKFFLLQSKWISNFVIVDCNRRWHFLCSMFTPLKVRPQRGEKYTVSLTLWFPEVINIFINSFNIKLLPKISLHYPTNKLIRQKMSSCSNRKYSQLINKVMCSSKKGELTIKSWEFKG